MPKTECLVIKAFNNDLLVTIDEQVFESRKLKRNKTYSKEFDKAKENEEKKTTKYIPKMTHP